MQQLIGDSATINETYSINGLQTNGEKEEFINSLSTVSNISSEDLVEKSNGGTIDDSFMKLVIIGFIFALVHQIILVS
jgi:hypothetical protein